MPSRVSFPEKCVQNISKKSIKRKLFEKFQVFFKLSGLVLTGVVIATKV